MIKPGESVIIGGNKKWDPAELDRIAVEEYLKKRHPEAALDIVHRFVEALAKWGKFYCRLLMRGEGKSVRPDLIVNFSVTINGKMVFANEDVSIHRIVNSESPEYYAKHIAILAHKEAMLTYVSEVEKGVRNGLEAEGDKGSA